MGNVLQIFKSGKRTGGKSNLCCNFQNNTLIIFLWDKLWYNC